MLSTYTTDYSPRLGLIGALFARALLPARIRWVLVWLWLCSSLALLLGPALPAQAGVTVIAHKEIAGVDVGLLGRIFTGRTTQVDGIAVHPVNLKAGDEIRAEFLRLVLQQNDDDYIAYWIVRRSIGRGVPPPEAENAREVVAYVRSTPGAIGYIDEASVEPGMTVLFRLP